MSQENQDIQPSSPPKNPPFWKASLIKVLRATIGVLETTAVKLETQTPPSSEDKPGFLQKLQQGWSGILAKIRLFLPAQFSAKLSDTALTGIISGITIMVFLITSNLSASKPPQIAIVPPNTETNPVVSITNPQSEETASLPPEQEIPSTVEQQEQPQQTPDLPPEQEITATVEQQEQPQQTPDLPPEQEITATVEQQEQPQQTPLIEPQQQELETTPTPLTPEETLIAAIQNQIAEISVTPKGFSSANRTFSGIIQSIQVNFLDSNLMIKISNDWYSLDKKQQDKLAAEIWQRSQELDFTHLEITDVKSKILARNPVVGTEMIILKRK
ncbi:hypothetical protein IQ247_30545 [Plectonema cf. radiosum LEGE 06105]|uniref:Uncharacterized protein n=1 Tax=Plectonema cf. radiosum LEGE 06105 TaxID=945769 RepID=A0A8J7FPW0_9CYAN|nr:hypothetical protein [Plectonema radiosum]MBE9216941.1 hypothetical protein [Plectonema cf. radiosum LEGE 06105]